MELTFYYITKVSESYLFPAKEKQLQKGGVHLVHMGMQLQKKFYIKNKWIEILRNLDEIIQTTKVGDWIFLYSMVPRAMLCQELYHAFYFPYLVFQTCIYKGKMTVISCKAGYVLPSKDLDITYIF